jgi:transcriptional regulator with XRE-family HTH domain
VLSERTSSNGSGAGALGAQVRALRRERGLTLKALGQRAGLSHPFLSQVERGLAQPSLGSVERIADALGVPVAHLWNSPQRLEGALVLRRGEGPAAEPMRELAPSIREWSGGSRRWPAAETASGEVLVYVARGAVEVDLDGTVHRLGEGDALRFAGAIPHRLRRSGGPGTRALIVAAN